MLLTTNNKNPDESDVNQNRFIYLFFVHIEKSADG